jgi:hypothetical protein
MTVQVSPNFSFSKEWMKIREFVTSDREVVSFFENLTEVSRQRNFEQALRMGVVALKSISLTDKIDYVEKRFTQFERTMEEMSHNSDSRTKDTFTEFEKRMGEVFGEQGIFSELLKEHFGENGKIVRDLFDPSKIGTPMYFLKNEIMKELGDIKKQIEIDDEVEKLRQMTTLKGFDFQKYCENVLNKIAKWHADTLEYTGNKTGKITNCKVGDYVMELGDSIGKKLVFEIKDVNNISTTDIHRELEDAKKNREAEYAIFVIRDFEALPKSVGWFNEYNENKLVCALGKNGNDGVLHEELLYIAYKWAKSKLILESPKENKIDFAALRQKGEAAKYKLKVFQSVLTQCGNLEKSTNEIRTIIKDAEREIKEDLEAIINAVNPSH